jgi:heme exporter protein D
MGGGLREGIRVSWGSWENFLAMGGYAFYVWGSYLVTLGLVLAEIVLLALRKRSALARLRLHGTAAQGDR